MEVGGSGDTATECTASCPYSVIRAWGPKLIDSLTGGIKWISLDPHKDLSCLSSNTEIGLFYVSYKGLYSPLFKDINKVREEEAGRTKRSKKDLTEKFGLWAKNLSIAVKTFSVFG